MDSHKRPDVIKYCNDTFLCSMEKYQAKMVKWEIKESELVQIDPVLGPCYILGAPIFIFFYLLTNTFPSHDLPLHPSIT